MPVRLNISETPESVIMECALKFLREGKIISYPTETYYALGVACDSAEGLKRLWKLKKRPRDKPFPLIAADVNQLVTLASGIGPEALALTERYWPGPLTILFTARAGLSPYITSAAGKVAVRVPGGTIALALARYVRFPITSTSANISNAPPADDAQTVKDYFGDSIDMIIDGGKTPGGPPSTIVEVLNGGGINIIRQGAVNLS